MLHDIVGFRLISNDALVERRQVRFPRSKKRRIRKKWRRRPENWRTAPSREMWRVGDCIVAHSALIDELRRHVRDEQERFF